MPENDIEQTANSTPATPEEAPKLDRRAAIAQARAIRREAAAKADSNKEQAAEAANSILEQAAPEPPRQPMHKQTAPVPVSNTTGRFGWLDEMRKPAVAKANADEIVEQLIAEAEERAARPKPVPAPEPESVRKAVVDQILAESKRDAGDAETIVAQVIAETARSQSLQAEQLSFHRARPDISRAVSRSSLQSVRVEKKPAPVQVENVLPLRAPLAGAARPRPAIHAPEPVVQAIPPTATLIPPTAVHGAAPVVVEQPPAETVPDEPELLNTLSAPAEEPVDAADVTEEVLYEKPAAENEVFDEEPVTDEEVFDEEPVAAEEVFDEEPVAAEEVFDEEPVTGEDVFDEEPVTEEDVFDEEPVNEEEVFDEEPVSEEGFDEAFEAEEDDFGDEYDAADESDFAEEAADEAYDSEEAYDDADAPYDDESDAETDSAPRYRRYSDSAAPDNAGAAEDYRNASREARDYVKKLSRKNEHVWSKEASSHLAADTEKRTAKRAAVWNIAVFLLLLFSVAAGMLLLERPTISVEENRTLAKMPEFSAEDWLDGSYTNGVSEYYNDTVPFRSVFKGWTQKLRTLLGIQGIVIHGSVAAPVAAPEETTAETTVTTLQTELGVEVTTTRATTTVAAEEPEEEPVQGAEMSGGILISDKRGIMLFGGWESMGENYANILNRFQADLPDVKMYNMVIPTNCSFYTPPEYQDLITSEKANIDYINNHLQGVIPVDAYSALEKHKDEPIFMRTDHHWSSLGSFYAAEKFSAAARVPFAPMSEYDRHSKEGYVGTLYSFSNDIILKNNPEEFFWFVPHAQFKTTYYNRSYSNPYEGSLFMDIENVIPVSWYMVYIAGDDHVVHVETEVGNGRKLAVIKDSYGNALIPWLTSSFEEIYVIDMRFFDLNAVRFMKEHGITDVLFTMNSFSANSANADAIEKIRVQ